MKLSYNHTLYAGYLGYITQAIVNNFAPLLFLTFSRQFGLTLDRLALITTVNFGVQLLVDLCSARLIDRIGYRICIVWAHLFSAAGLVCLALLPFCLGYGGILASVVLYAVGGGLIEVMISPIVEACPTERKEAAMSLLHSFYCWGHVAVILVSTLFFRLAGIRQWRLLSLLWALVPLCNTFYFMAVPLYPITKDGRAMPLRKLLRQRAFWVLLLVMVCAGASEQGMSQWASAFTESALHIPKAVGDLLGPCAFAVTMGTARTLYGKYADRLPLQKAMTASAVLCFCAYLLAAVSANPIPALAGCALCGFSVGIFWPGTFSIAAARLPAAGTAMYALLALAGDVGCSGGPTLVGFVANACGGNLHTGLLAALCFPAVILLGIYLLKPRDIA